MKIYSENISNLFHIINSIAPLIFTIKDIDNINILNNIMLSNECTNVLHNICEKMHNTIFSSLYNNVYYFEDELNIRYMGIGVFNHGEHKHTIVIGPYLINDSNIIVDEFKSITCFHDNLQVLSSMQEKTIASVALSLTSDLINENNFIKIESENIPTTIFSDDDFKKILLI